MGTLKPKQNIGAQTAEILNEGGFGELVGPYAQIPGVLASGPNGPADDPRSYVSATYEGTPQQQSLEEFRQAAANGGPEAQRILAYIEAQQAAGDNSLPYQLFDKEKPEVKEVGGFIYEFHPEIDGGVWVRTGESRDKTGQMTDPRRIATFNGIANAADRSPFIKTADRTIVLEQAYKDIESDPSDPAKQMNLAYSYIQALDTYQ